MSVEQIGVSDSCSEQECGEGPVAASGGGGATAAERFANIAARATRADHLAVIECSAGTASTGCAREQTARILQRVERPSIGCFTEFGEMNGVGHLLPVPRIQIRLDAEPRRFSQGCVRSLFRFQGCFPCFERAHRLPYAALRAGTGSQTRLDCVGGGHVASQRQSQHSGRGNAGGEGGSNTTTRATTLCGSVAHLKFGVLSHQCRLCASAALHRHRRRERKGRSTR